MLTEVDAGIADVHVGEAHELPLVGRVCQDLLRRNAKSRQSALIARQTAISARWLSRHFRCFYWTANMTSLWAACAADQHMVPLRNPRCWSAAPLRMLLCSSLS